MGISREQDELDKIKKNTKCIIEKATIKEDTFCGICQTSVYCSWCVYLGKNIKPDDYEEYEIPEGFVDQGIERGKCNLWCNLCTIDQIDNSKISESDIVIKVNCSIESLSQLRDNMKNNTKDFSQWT